MSIFRVNPILILSIGLLAALSANAEVLFLNDGEIIIGDIENQAEGGVAYSAFGRRIVVDVAQVYKTDTKLSVLFERKTSIELRDGTSFQGKVADYDKEIGLFLDIGFGVLTIPTSSLKSVIDPVRRVRYAGAPWQVQAGGSFNAPLLDSSTYFGAFGGFEAGGSWSIPALRGLCAGAELVYALPNYTYSSRLSYSLWSFMPTATYKHLDLRMREDWLGMFVPYASLSAGPAYIAVKDSGASPSSYGNLTFGLKAALGLEFFPLPSYFLRLEARGTTYLQSGTPFYAFGAALLAGYQP